MAIPKKPGIYNVTLSNGQKRRVQRFASGKVKFLKSTTRKRASTTSRRAPAKRRTTTRRQAPMARKKTTRRRAKTFSILGSAVAINAIVQALEPYITAGVMQAVQAQDVNAFMAALQQGTKEAVTVANILQAAGPAVTLGVMKKLVRSVGLTPPKFGNIRAW